MKYTSLDNCTILYDELTCDIDKYQLYKILSYQGEKFCLGEKLDTEGLYIFNSVLDISFRFKDTITKREETVQIGKLLTPTVSKNEFIVYETNIKEITALTSDYFEMGIKSKVNENLNINDNEKLKCFFKKDYFNSLLLFCEATKDGVYSLGQISPQNLENINILYNFTLEESTNDYKFNISDIGTKITSVSHSFIEFKGNQNYKIKYETENPERLKGIKLNIESSFDLDCEDKIWYKECSINQTHFTKNGSYYTYHSNHLGAKTISYETPKISIILEGKKSEPTDDNDNKSLIIGLSIAGGIIVIIIIIFLIWHYLRKRNSKDINLDLEKDEMELKAPISSDYKE